MLQAVHAHLGRAVYEHRRAADRDQVVDAVWRSLHAAGMIPQTDGGVGGSSQ